MQRIGGLLQVNHHFMLFGCIW